MPILSQSTMCLQMHMKGPTPLQRSIPKTPVHKSHSSIITLSGHLPRIAQHTNLSACGSIGAPSIFSPSFKGNVVSIKSKLNGTIVYNAYNPATETVGDSPPDAEREKDKLSQVTKRLESTGRYFKRLGELGFWSQLVCTTVSSAILSFSVVITGSPSSPATFYMTAVGIVAAFLSVFWSFRYIRLSERLRKTANDPAKAPPRADVVNSLKNGIVINIIGMGATVLGMQATVGLLVAKALTSPASPYYQGLSPSYSPVLALDVFLVQACGNTLLSHFLGLVFSLALLKSVTLPSPPENVNVKLA